MMFIAGMKKVAGTWCRSRTFKILGKEVVAPYSPTDNGTGRRFGLCNNSLSTSNEMQTATLAPSGQDLGVSFLPILAPPTTCQICSSVESTVIGVAPVAEGWGAGRGDSQAYRNPRATSRAALGVLETSIFSDLLKRSKESNVSMNVSPACLLLARKLGHAGIDLRHEREHIFRLYILVTHGVLTGRERH